MITVTFAGNGLHIADVQMHQAPAFGDLVSFNLPGENLVTYRINGVAHAVTGGEFDKPGHQVVVEVSRIHE